MLRAVALASPSSAPQRTLIARRALSCLVSQRSLRLPARGCFNKRLAGLARGFHRSAAALAKKAPYYAQAEGALPAHWARRIEVWDKEQARQTAAASGKPISVTVDGKVYEALAGLTTPATLCEGKLVGTSLVALQKQVGGQDGTVVDLTRPLTGDCELEYLSYEHPLGAEAFWHSSAHVLGQALEYKYRDYAVSLHDGPPLEHGGFYYDTLIQQPPKPQEEGGKAAAASSSSVAVSESDLPELTKLCAAVIKDKQPFERLVVSREVARDLFRDNPFKLAILDHIGEDEEVTAYRCGPLVDLCRGPHVPHTGRIKALQATKCAGNVVKGDASAASVPLQRVYGVAFPDKAKMKAWTKLQEEAAKRDHRLLGKQQELFMFHDLSPGSAFFLPHGTRVYNTLVAYLRAEYRSRGYEEVRTPLLFDPKLWKMSGHWDNYKDNMFIAKGFQNDQDDLKHGAARGVKDDADTDLHRDCCGGESSAEQEGYGVKPMNCPGHCLIFASRVRSYRELPLRMADFSTLHRNELSGALTGLTRVRRFAQDDAHVFCSREQMADEIKACLNFVSDVYSAFGFEFRLALSTRPEDKYIGELSVWDEAEAALTKCLDDFGGEWDLNPGDGAFYGPKVDVRVKDALGREHQCATIQLDFQLPERFDLKYTGPDGEQERPVMIHRAILGSVERMLAVLLEHYGGRWPLWLSPRQVNVVPVTPSHEDYAQQVTDKLREAGLFVDTSGGKDTLNKKVRAAQVAQYNYILVVGDKEQQEGTVNVRTREGQVLGTKPLGDFEATLLKEVNEKKTAP